MSRMQKGERSMEYSKGSFLLLKQHDTSLRQINDF